MRVQVPLQLLTLKEDKMEFYIIGLLGAVSLAGYTWHIFKMQGEIDYLNDQMERQARKFEEKK